MLKSIEGGPEGAQEAKTLGAEVRQQPERRS